MNMEERKAAWRSLHDQKRRAVVMINWQDEQPRPWPYPELKKKRIDWALKNYRDQMERAEWLHDDRVPCLLPYTGTEIFAHAFGCRVHMSGDNMPFALPLVNSAEEAALLKTPDPEAGLAEVWEIAEALHAAEPDALLALPDIQSPLDISALIWEKSDFYAAMLEEPEAVLELNDKVLSLLTGFLDRWKERFGQELIAHYPDYYMPGGLTLSEDEVGVIGAAMFDTFCLPDLNALSRRYGSIGIHCCADSEHQWQNFKKIENLKVINLVRPADILERAYPVFRDTCIQMPSISHIDEQGAFSLPDSARGSRVVLQANARNRDEALRALETLRQGQEKLERQA